MRFSSVFMFLGIVVTGILANPLDFDDFTSLDARDADFEARNLYDAFFEERDLLDFDSEVDARDYEDHLDARGPHHGVSARESFGDELDERDFFEDAGDLEVRYDDDIEGREIEDLDARMFPHFRIGTVVLPPSEN